MKTTINALTGKSILTLVLVLLFLTPAFSQTPEIYSIVPDWGVNDSPTDVTVHGANFEATPKVALYGGGPTVIGSADTPGSAQAVHVSGNYAYVADGGSGLQVIDITDSANPTIVSSVTGFAEGVHVIGNYAYVTDFGLQVIDISDPIKPSIMGETDMIPFAIDVYVTGSYAYVLGDGYWDGIPVRLCIVDISNPLTPTIVTCQDIGPWFTYGKGGVHVLGNYAYVGGWLTGLQVIDISDPENPAIVGSVDTPGKARGLFVSGNYAYVADGDSGLQVVDVSNPTNPTIVGSAGAPGSAQAVHVSGNYAYVADGGSGLQVIDVSDPENLAIVGSEDTPGSARDVFVSGNHVYVADGDSGLQVLRAFEPCTNSTFVDSSTLTATVPAGLPLGTYNLHVVNPSGERAMLPNSFTVLPVFQDVPLGYWAEEFIYKIYNAGITAGCAQNPLRYCPESTATRAQMAIFLVRGIHGSSFDPPAATGIFADVPVNYWAADWIEQFYDDGITAGCRKNPLRYCPDSSVTRAQMAIFLLRAKHGSGYTPPPATGIFDDVPVTRWAADWIEQLYREGITAGCKQNPLSYCPESSVTRAMMAIFLVRTFGL